MINIALVESTTCQAVVVDPFLEDTAGSSSSAQADTTAAQVGFCKASAEDFADSSKRPFQEFHQVLLKEVAHHLKDRPQIFRGFYDCLVPSPKDRHSLLIITRPQKDIDYPLWEEARDVWAKNQPSSEEFVSELEGAGFTNVEQTTERYPCSIPLERWQSMVKNRFWSTFAGFSDEELAIACANMPEYEKSRIRDGSIHFEDRLLFISASKS